MNDEGIEFIENPEIALEDLADEDLDIRDPAHQKELERRCDKMTEYVLNMCSGNRLDVVVIGVCNAVGQIVLEPAHRPALNYNMEIVRRLSRDLEQELGSIKFQAQGVVRESAEKIKNTEDTASSNIIHKTHGTEQ